jgi:hypothetical protein
LQASEIVIFFTRIAKLVPRKGLAENADVFRFMESCGEKNGIISPHRTEVQPRMEHGEDEIMKDEL